MKFKYFIRGLGIGIIFGAIVMLVAAGTSDKEKLTDEEIVERAEKLGMVWEEATQTNAVSDESKNTESVVMNDTEEATETVTDVNTTEEKTEAVTKATTEIETETTEKTTEASTEKNTYTEATITVTRGMSSTSVAEMLEDADIIEDAEDFDNYLVKEGISNKIQVSSFKLNSNMTYEDIAKVITTPVEN